MRTQATALGLVLFAVLSAPFVHAQSAAIAVDRTQHFNQTSAAAPVPEALPVSFNFNIRGGLTNMSTWGPAFYKPGTGETPSTGASSATNTGTVNFSTTPNNGGDYLFVHDFASTAALEAFYPNGNYGIKFQGSGVSPAAFTAGLQFVGSVYPSVVPRVIGKTNGAEWVAGRLRLASSGLTTLTINNFTEYASTTYGAVIGVGIYETMTGNVVTLASKEAYDLPLGDSTATPTPHHDPAFNTFSIDSAWLTPGVPYTLEIHYTVFSGRPEEAVLTPGGEFQGVASSRMVTTIQLMVPGSSADFNADGQSDIIWRNTQTGEWAFWLMNGTDIASGLNQGVMPLEWQVSGMGDFNADGKTDIIWRNTQSGDYAFWLMNGTQVVSGLNKGPMPLNWQIAGTGDFNADSQSDIIWRNAQTGEYAFWLMNGTDIAAGLNKGVRSLAWQITGTGDFNADGQSDIIWRNTQTGEYAFWLMNGTDLGTAVDKPAMPLEWQITGTGDFNADGQSDIIWRNQQSGDYAFWLMNGTDIVSGLNKGPMPLQWQTVR